MDFQTLPKHELLESMTPSSQHHYNVFLHQGVAEANHVKLLTFNQDRVEEQERLWQNVQNQDYSSYKHRFPALDTKALVNLGYALMFATKHYAHWVWLQGLTTTTLPAPGQNLPSSADEQRYIQDHLGDLQDELGLAPPTKQQFTERRLEYVHLTIHNEPALAPASTVAPIGKKALAQALEKWCRRFLSGK